MEPTLCFRKLNNFIVIAIISINDTNCWAGFDVWCRLVLVRRKVVERLHLCLLWNFYSVLMASKLQNYGEKIL